MISGGKMKHNINFKKFYVRPRIPNRLKTLDELSMNIWSTWNSDAYRLFSRIDPLLFRKYNHNPVKLLHNVKHSKLEELSENKGFLYELNSVYKRFKNYLSYTGYYKNSKGETQSFSDDFLVAYFSMEYGLHESLPVYSGGLGVLAGDHLKAASDSKLPFVAFGLLYKYGYFFQEIDQNGNQKEIYKENEWHSKPVSKLRTEDGQDLIINIKINGEPLYIQVWKIDVGSVELYLLDTNLPENKEQFRQITDYLYISDRDLRMLQEILLAYGSIELMQKLNIKPSVYHLNEGHSAFLIIKRIEDLVAKGYRFKEAKEIICGSTVFTTHTPVPAGNERFDFSLIDKYLKDKIEKTGENPESFKNYAKVANDDHFQMSALAIRFSNYINGVSELHSKVSKKMWHEIYPNIFEDEMPIKAITNGVHHKTWLSRSITRLFDRYIGSDYLHMAEKRSVWKNVLNIPLNEIWDAHQRRKQQTITFLRNRINNSIMLKGSLKFYKKPAQSILKLDHLVIGFARRFAQYKRADLILHDKDRLLNLINDPHRPVQFVFSGKAHPADEKGKGMINKLLDFARENDIEDKFIFIEDYDINVARHLVQGVDVWLNNPIKPMEASGTSGMKAGMNGILNLSVLDGWYPESYTPENGWAITAGEDVEDPQLRRSLEANQIYEILENQIRKLYYDRDENGLPVEWIKMMRQSMHDVGSSFNMHKTLRNYINKFYLPSKNYSDKLIANDSKLLNQILQSKDKIQDYWNDIKILNYKLDIPEVDVFNSDEVFEVTVEVYLGDTSEGLFEVEIFYKYESLRYKIIKLDFIEKREDKIAIYKGKMRTVGSGNQEINIRIKPFSCDDCQENYEYVKWYF